MALPMIFSIGFIVFIFLVVFLSKAAGNRALLLILLVMGLAFPALFFLVMGRHVSHVVPAVRPVGSAAHAVLGLSDTPSTDLATVSSPPIWTEGMEEQFEADVYPSKERAATALAVQASTQLPQVMADNTPPTAVTVYGDNEITVQLLNAFADELRKQGNLTQVVVQTVLPQTLSSDPQTATLILDMPNRQHRVQQRDSVAYCLGAGTLRTRIHGTGDRQVTRTVEFLEKPWVNDLGAILNQYKDAAWAIARSDGTCTSQLEAQQQAMANVRSLVSLELQRMPRPNTVLSRELSVSDLDAKANELIVDRFTQSFYGTAGRIWRQAILLDLSHHKLQQILNTKVRYAQTRHQAWAGKLASLLGLGLIVLILYIFLNAATKGYYTITLKIVACVLIAVVVAAVILC